MIQARHTGGKITPTIPPPVLISLVAVAQMRDKQRQLAALRAMIAARETFGSKTTDVPSESAALRAMIADRETRREASQQ